jgi:uncharacterized protein YecE (DUF72 family)
MRVVPARTRPQLPTPWSAHAKKYHGDPMAEWIGTSGFQYPEWKGTFYPETLATAKMLGYYSERFRSTEVNYTFRHLPSAKTLDRWCRETPEQFRFALKAPQRITHFAKLRGSEQLLEHFVGIIGDLESKLGPVLFQLPPQFKKDTEVLGAFVGKFPPGLRAAFEFRHASWFDEEVFDVLRSANVALCIADTSDFKTPLVATASFGYLRLRNENYTDADLAAWADSVRTLRAQWEDAFIYLKHEEKGVGPAFAQRLIESLAA